MKRCTVLIMLLAMSVWAAAQTTQTTVTTANPQVMVAPGAIAGQNGLSTNTGTAVIIAPPSAPLVVTPEVHLTTVVPSPGATNATPGNVAGAANSTAAMPVPPRLQTTVPQYSMSGASVTQTAPPPENTTTSTGATGVTALPTTTAGTPVLVLNNRRYFDLGVGTPTAVGAFGNTGGKSLGEIAREMRQREATANAHVYTNQDIQRINQQPGVVIGGMSGAAVGAGTATQPGASSNMPAVSQPTTNQPQTPGVSQPVPPNQNPPQSQAIPPTSLDQTRSTQMAQNNMPPNPAAQNEPRAPAPSTGTPQASGRRLPSSASILPLMAVVGVLAAGAGLLAR